jgi:hypothetical protein
MIRALTPRQSAIAVLMAQPWGPAPVDPDQTLRVRSFLHALSDAGLDIATNAITAVCRAGHGFILTPDMGPPRVTHLFEITLFDLSATGMTLPEAANNWLTIARRCATPDAA